ncbi:MAG: PAS domain S-box protein [Betaproteobacteria bacterium]|nr:PAS domain S-box protein [Betaproteobacteria bacterium]
MMAAHHRDADSPGSGRRIFRLATLGTAAIAAFVVAVGWGLDWAPARTIVPGWPATTPATATGIGLLGLSLATAASTRSRLASVGAAVLVLLVCLWALVLVPAGFVPPGDSPWLSLPSIATSVTLATLAVGSLLVSGNPARRYRVVGLVALVGLMLPLHRLFVLALSGPGRTGASPFDTMSLPTATMLAVLGIAGLLLHPNLPYRSLAAARDTLGTLFRAGIAVAVFAPLLTAAGVLLGSRIVDQDLEGLLAWASTAMSLVLASLLWTGLQMFVRLQARTESLAQRFERLFRFSPMGKVLVDDTGRIRTANPASERIFGYRAGELVGRSIEDLVPEPLRDVHRRQRNEFERPGDSGIGASNRAVDGLRADGSRVPLEITLTTLPDEEGEMVLATMADISARRAAELALQESENRYRQLTQSLPQLVWTCRPTGECDFLNAQWVAYTGVPEQAQLPYGWLDHVHPDDRDALMSSWKAAVETGDDMQVEFRIRRHDGLYRWFDTRATAIKDVEGRIVKWFGSNTDIEDRKLFEVRLHETQRRFELAVQATREGLWDWNLVTDDIYLSPQWFAMLGYAEGEVPYRGDFRATLIHPDEAQGWRTVLQQHFDARTPFHSVECRFRAHDGTYRWMLDRGQVVERDADGRPLRMVGTDTDISDRKVLELSLRQQTEDLTRSNADLERFAYIASHDLQEPLRMVASFLQLLDRKYEGKLDDTGRQYLDFAVGGARRMQALIQDLLRYSRAGRSDEPLVRVDMNRALAVALDNLSVAIADAGAKVSPDVLPPARGQAGELTQVFQNLVQNALRYGGEAAPELKISGECTDDGMCTFSVQDNGVGIAPQHQDRIFELFKRLNPNDGKSGTGIGLATCKRIIERFGGRIWVESQPGAGSTFRFTLPSDTEQR